MFIIVRWIDPRSDSEIAQTVYPVSLLVPKKRCYLRNIDYNIILQLII